MTPSAVVAFRQFAGDPQTLGDMLSTPGALRSGHFELLSGQHTGTFLAFSAIAADSRNLDSIATWLLPTVEAWAPDAVLSPSTAGVGLASTLARRLSAQLFLASPDATGRPATIIGQVLPRTARVLLVNDVTTTGAAIRALADLVVGVGATVAGAAWFASRNVSMEMQVPYPFVRLADIDLSAHASADCELCHDDVIVPERAIDLN